MWVLSPPSLFPMKSQNRHLKHSVCFSFVWVSMSISKSLSNEHLSHARVTADGLKIEWNWIEMWDVGKRQKCPSSLIFVSIKKHQKRVSLEIWHFLIRAKLSQLQRLRRGYRLVVHALYKAIQMCCTPVHLYNVQCTLYTGILAPGWPQWVEDSDQWED